MDPENPPRRRSQTFVVLTMIIVLCIIAGSQPLHAPPININRAQYDAALARWNAAKINEYQATIRLQRPGGGLNKWKMVVHIDRTSGNPVENVTSIDDLTAPTNDQSTELGKSFSIGAEFRDLGELLQCPDLKCTSADDLFDTYYNIQFDPILGYPRTVTIRSYARPDLGPDHYDSPVLISVEDLKVLK